MLPDAGEVHETQVDGRDLALSDLREYFFGGHAGILRAVLWLYSAVSLKFTIETG